MSPQGECGLRHLIILLFGGRFLSVVFMSSVMACLRCSRLDGYSPWGKLESYFCALGLILLGCEADVMSLKVSKVSFSSVYSDLLYIKPFPSWSCNSPFWTWCCSSSHSIQCQTLHHLNRDVGLQELQLQLLFITWTSLKTINGRCNFFLLSHS